MREQILSSSSTTNYPFHATTSCTGNGPEVNSTDEVDAINLPLVLPTLARKSITKLASSDRYGVKSTVGNDVTFAKGGSKRYIPSEKSVIKLTWVIVRHSFWHFYNLSDSQLKFLQLLQVNHYSYSFKLTIFAQGISTLKLSVTPTLLLPVNLSATIAQNFRNIILPTARLMGRLQMSALTLLLLKVEIEKTLPLVRSNFLYRKWTANCMHLSWILLSERIFICL